MTAWLCATGVALAALSAFAFYAGSPHCMWPRWRGHPGLARFVGALLALASLTAWTLALGVTAGASAMLVGWMLALVAQPWLALFMGNPDADVTEKD